MEKMYKKIPVPEKGRIGIPRYHPDSWSCYDCQALYCVPTYASSVTGKPRQCLIEIQHCSSGRIFACLQIPVHTNHRLSEI